MLDWFFQIPCAYACSSVTITSKQQRWCYLLTSTSSWKKEKKYPFNYQYFLFTIYFISFYYLFIYRFMFLLFIYVLINRCIYICYWYVVFVSSLCLSARLFFCMPVCQSAFLSVYLPVYLSICLSVCCLPFYPSARPLVSSLPVCFLVCLPVS